MTYTFDEAIEELRLAIPERFYSPTMHDIAVMLEAQTKVINLLREEYAPTIEMTKEQKEVFLFYKNTTWFSLFLGKLNDPDNKEFRSLPNLNAFKDWGFQKKRECELMQVWLHPETIKIVEEIGEGKYYGGRK